MASWESRLRAGQGPFWGRAKRIARSILSFHVPVNGITRPFFAALYRLHVCARELLLWLARFFWNEPLFRSQCTAVGPKFYMEQLPYIAGEGKITIGEAVRISGKIQIGFGRLEGPQGLPELIVGDGTFIGHGCDFSIARQVRIGRNCLLASEAKFRDWDGHPLDAAERRSNRRVGPDGAKAVIIGDDVWIGTSATILKGITIGDRAVVAAGSIVTRDVPQDTVVAGNPARVIKDLAPATARSALGAGSAMAT